MPAKPTFNPEQQEAIWAAARRVYKRDFAWMKKEKDKPGGQEAMGLAIGVSQQTVSNLLKGTYSPGVKVASNIANLDGKTLQQLVGDFLDPVDDEGTRVHQNGQETPSAFRNLDVCLQFHAATKHWNPWTIAAARAGFFGNADFAPPEWAGKLDHLEKALEKARKT